MENIQIGFALTKDEVPEIIIVIVANGQVVGEKNFTAEIMTIAAEKTLAQNGESIGRIVNPDGSIGDLVKFTASKIKGLH